MHLMYTMVTVLVRTHSIPSLTLNGLSALWSYGQESHASDTYCKPGRVFYSFTMPSITFLLLRDSISNAVMFYAFDDVYYSNSSGKDSCIPSFTLTGLSALWSLVAKVMLQIHCEPGRVSTHLWSYGHMVMWSYGQESHASDTL